MAKRSFSAATWTPTATADTTALANSTFMSIGASGATAGLNVLEIYLGGQATSSAVNIMQFARDSTLIGTPTALAAPNSDGPLNTMTAALAAVPITAVAGGTSPQRSAATTAARLSLTFNAFGGIVRWVAAPGEEWGIVGVTVNVSESSLSAYTGGSVGLMGSHVVYEPF
jgi:hypothetical protein